MVDFIKRANVAPIVVMTYSRLGHFRKTVESLKRNDLAMHSILYVLIDGPRHSDREKVDLVIDFAKSISGFRGVEVRLRKDNNRIASYVDGMNEVLNEHKKVIFLEDDNVVSTKFLDYMNHSLLMFENDKSVLSISGYNVPVKFPLAYKKDIYLSRYFNAWGFATWADRETLAIEQSHGQYNEIISNNALRKKINQSHPELISALKKINMGLCDAGDYKLVYHQIKYDLYTVKPVRSLVNNIGHDGTGLHCERSNIFLNEELAETMPRLERDLVYQKELDRISYNYTRANRLKRGRLLKRGMGKLGRLVATLKELLSV